MERTPTGVVLRSSDEAAGLEVVYRLDLDEDGVAQTATRLENTADSDYVAAAVRSVQIETCASGGGRVDLGILQRTDRVWPSDTIDALERQHIQRWTTLLVPLS